jgi:hypothetical protein
MATAVVDEARRDRAGASILACVAGEGSASHPWFASESLLTGPAAARNLADAVHLLCTLHGRHPGVLDLAASQCTNASAQAFVSASADAFAGERHYLARLAVAIGPVPGTPGSRASEAAVRGQQVALATLARSERDGCALGAALAFVADWDRVRKILDAAARRVGLDVPPQRLAGALEAAAAADDSAASPAVRRALLFGAQQFMAQHRGLWDLLEARALARGS